MNWSKVSVAWLVGLLACAAQARVHHFGAELDESAWQLDGSVVQCELRHTIPHYGEAVFTQGVDSELEFSVRVMRTPGQNGKEATLQSLPPKWRHDLVARDLGTVNIQASSQPFRMGRAMARRLLLELENGMFPTLYYSDWADSQDEINVSISSVNFAGPAKDFLACLSGLLPYGFKDIQHSRLHFGANKTQLDDKEKRVLDKIASYVLASPHEVRVNIEGHTDAKGFRRVNRKVSLQRANLVKQYLLGKGLKAAQMQVSGFGESKPVASNRTRKGRAANRRVEVTLIK